MFYVYENEKVIHLIPGQGWRMVLAEASVQEDGKVDISDEPIIAWAIVEMEEREDFAEGERIQQLVPIVRELVPGRGYIWEFSQWRDMGTVLLAPGEKRTPEHDERALERMKEVTALREKKYEKWKNAREMRRSGSSCEQIAEVLHIPQYQARALAMQEDERMRKEGKK